MFAKDHPQDAKFWCIRRCLAEGVTQIFRINIAASAGREGEVDLHIDSSREMNDRCA